MTNILNLPDSAIFNRTLPKNALWQKAERQNVLKRYLTNEFDNIVWLYKLSSSTLNLLKEQEEEEINIFCCKMKGNKEYSLEPFEMIDRLIPHRTMFIVCIERDIDIIMRYKEKNSRGWTLYPPEVMRNVNLLENPISISGQTINSVYFNLLSAVAGFEARNEDEYLKKAEIRKTIYCLKKELESLKRKMNNERQYNRQIEMRREIKNIENELSSLNSML